MRASTAVILCLTVAACGWLLGMLVMTWEAMTCLTIIAMGGCIIYTINKNFEALRADMKKKESEKTVQE